MSGVSSIIIFYLWYNWGLLMHISKRLLLNISMVLLLIFMFLFPIATIKGATSGLLLWFNTILPNLLPFIIVSNIIIKLNITDYICMFFNPIFKKIFKVSKNGCYPIIMGLMSGYPIGAKTCADMVSMNKISKSEGQYLLSLCNNASITYITSYIAITILKMPSMQYIILGIIYLSAFISSNISKKVFHLDWNSSSNLEINKLENKIIKKPFNFRETIDNSIMNGFEVITKIGGYIILFSVISHIIITLTSTNNGFASPIIITIIKHTRLLIMGILEITTGTYLIGAANVTFNTKFLLIIMITAFGGFSSLAQTYSVLHHSNLSIKMYIKTKIMNAVVASIISYCYILIFL